MSQNADYGQIETILMRADVYRTAYRRMSIIALALLVVAVIAVLAAVSLALTKPEPRDRGRCRARPCSPGDWA